MALLLHSPLRQIETSRDMIPESSIIFARGLYVVAKARAVASGSFARTRLQRSGGVPVAVRVKVTVRLVELRSDFPARLEDGFHGELWDV